MTVGDLVGPFRGLRLAPGRADDIAAPPYDVVNREEARAAAEGKPYSFFHVSRAEIDLAPDTDPYSDKVYEKAAANLQKFLSDGLLVQDETPCFYIYRISTGTLRQTGIAVSVSVDAYLENRVRKHELTRPSKEDDRVRQIEAVKAITGPVLCVHKTHAGLQSIVDELTVTAPETVAENVDGARHELWVVRDDAHVSEIARLMNAMDALYIADGHHLSAAGARVAAARREANPDHTGSESYNGFLAVSFPSDQVIILDYNRVVRDLNGQTPEALLDSLHEMFYVEQSSDPIRPAERSTFGMYMDGAWWLLKPRGKTSGGDPVDNLDVSLLTRMILEPCLGIGDQRTDTRIDFVGGSRGPEEIARRVDSGEMAVGFTLYPTSLDDLMAVADADMIMPPKSTWFDPKLADGMISQLLD